MVGEFWKNGVFDGGLACIWRTFGRGLGSTSMQLGDDRGEKNKRENPTNKKKKKIKKEKNKKKKVKSVSGWCPLCYVRLNI